MGENFVNNKIDKKQAFQLFLSKKMFLWDISLPLVNLLFNLGTMAWLQLKSEIKFNFHLENGVIPLVNFYKEICNRHLLLA